MPQQPLVDLVDTAPTWNRDLAIQLGHLARQHTCIPAMLASIMDSVTQLSLALASQDITSPQGIATFHRDQGAIVALKTEVSRIIAQMGGDNFSLEEEESEAEWANEEETSEEVNRAVRRVRPATPTKPKPKVKPAAKKAAKRTRKSTRK